MSLINPQLPKQYKNSKVLFEKNLDAWRTATEQGFAISNLNLTQLRKDCFLSTYDFDNDGIGNLPKSLQQQINDITTGAVPISGTTTNTWVINSDGNAVILSSAGLTATHTYTFPDLDGEIVTLNATQTLTNKTLTSPTINGGAITGATVDGVDVSAHDHTGGDQGVILSIEETQIPDGSILARVADNETITGSWVFPSADPPNANQLTRKSSLKGYAAINSSGTLFLDDFNVATGSKIGTGNYRITLDTVMASTTAKIGMVCSLDPTAWAVYAHINSTSVFDISTLVGSGVVADASCAILILGDQ